MALSYRAIPNPAVFGPLTYDQLILADSPVGYWPLSEASGTNANDASVNNNDGTYVASPTLGVTGPVTDLATAVTLNGTTQYVSSPDVAAWDIFEGTNAWTIEMWVNHTPDGSYRRLMEKATGGKVSFVSQNTDLLVVRNDNVAGDTLYADQLTSGWHHVVATFSGTQLALYVDSALRPPHYGGANPMASTRSIPAMTSELFIGCEPVSTNVFNGTLAKVALYNYVLSQAKIDARWARRV